MILVVGGAGYVGSELVKELVKLGRRVRVLDRGFFGFEALKGLNVEIVKADMRRLPKDVFDKVHTVINVGGLSNDPTAEYSPEANHEMNVVATYALGVDAKKKGVSKYILASSCSIYDVGLTDELGDRLLHEDVQVNPEAAYAKSKLEAEELLFELVDDNFEVIALRKGTIFGYSERMRYDLVVNTFVKAALRNKKLCLHNCGQMWRPMLALPDAVKAYILAADSHNMEGIYNVASFNIRISEIAIMVQSVLKEMGYPCELELQKSSSGIRNYRVSSERIRREGWNPTVTLEESVRDIVTNVVKSGKTDWDNPRYYNIKWMETLDEASEILKCGRKSYECI